MGNLQPLGTRRDVLVALAIVLALACTTLSCLLTLRVYPFTDLPCHLAEATIHKYARDPASLLSHYFRDDITLLKPTVAHAVILSLFPSVESGARVLYGAYVIAVPTLILLLLVLCRGDPWLAILSITLLYNYNVTWGFTGFTLAIPVFLLFLAINIRLLDRPTFLSGLSAAVVLVLLYWTHLLLFLFALLCYMVSEIVQHKYRSRPKRAVTLLPTIPGLVLLVTWVLSSEGVRGRSIVWDLKKYYLHEYLGTLAYRAQHLFNNHYQLAPGLRGQILAAFFTLGLFAPLLLAVRPRISSAMMASAARRMVVISTGCALFCFLVLPSGLPGQGILFQRYTVILGLGVVVVLGCLVQTRYRWVVRAWALLLATVYCGLWCQYFADFGAFVRPFDKSFLYDEGIASKTMGAIIDDACFRGRRVLPHLDNYHIVWNRGIAPTKIVNYRFGLVRMRDGMELPYYQAWIGEDTDIQKLIEEYATCDYLLVHGSRPYKAVVTTGGRVLIRQGNGWALFRSWGTK